MSRPAARLLSTAVMVSWTLAIVLAWRAWHAAALVTFAVGTALALWTLRRGGRARAAEPSLDPAAAERQARLVVTQILATLTKVQVTYLCQQFESVAEGREWLKRTLPRGFRAQLDAIHGDLEKARAGEAPPGLKLAGRVLALKDAIERLEAALLDARAGHPKHVLASPVAYVITEEIDEAGETEPLVVTLASLDPRQPTLLPRVELVNIFREEGGKRTIAGQLDFDGVLAALGTHATQTDDSGDVYVTTPRESISSALGRPPLGFVVGASDFV